MGKRDFYVHESEFDDFQQKIIARRVNDSFIVRGCAGSGKSILALWKAHEIQKNSKGTVQIIVYIKALKTFMETARRKNEMSTDIIVDYHGHWEKSMRCTKYLIVDEAQDFSQNDIKGFLRHADIVILYGDSAQQLYSFREDNLPINMEEIERFTGFPLEQLVFNYRLPKTIARVAQHISDIPDPLEERCKSKKVEKPFFLRFGSFEEQLSAITHIINNRDFEDVGILFRSNASVETAARFFRDNGWDVEAKTKETMDLNWDSSNPKLLTYHSAKGLQFEAVFLPECNKVREDDRKPLYVAMTRTYQSLYMMYSGQLSPMLSAVPHSLYETSLVTRETELL
jgi:superfamily I DNA/RNA helicase